MTFIFRWFSLLLLILSINSTSSADCDSELYWRDPGNPVGCFNETFNFIEPVQVSSLKLPEFFECLENHTKFNQTVGYHVDGKRLTLNITLGDLWHTTPEIKNTCASSNEYGLEQLDYIHFVEGSLANFTHIREASDDHSTVLSVFVYDGPNCNFEWIGQASPLPL